MIFSNCFIKHASVITPAGTGLEKNVQAVLDNKSFYCELDPALFGPDFPVYHAGLLTPADYQTSMPNLTKAEMILSKLIEDYLSEQQLPKIDAFFLLYKSVHPFEFFNEQKNLSFQDDRDSVMKIFDSHKLKIAKENIIIADNTCSTGLTLITSAAQGISLGLWENVLVCSIDLINPYILFVLNGLGAFAGNELASEYSSRPFDKKRTGFIKTESGSLALITKNRADNALMKISSFNQTNDAYRLTDGRDDCLYIKKAMTEAVQSAQCNLSDLAFIKTHGTGTRLNDEHEAKAIIDLFGSEMPVTSLKGHLGHTTDASGLIENLIAASALKKGLILHTKNCEESEYELNVVCNKPATTNKKIFLSNSFGFGGNNASAVFEVL